MHSAASSNIDCQRLASGAALVVFTGGGGEIKVAKLGLSSNALTAVVSPTNVTTDVTQRLALIVKGTAAPWNAVVVYYPQSGTNLKAAPLTVNASSVSVGTIATPTSGKPIKNYAGTSNTAAANNAGISSVWYSRINAMYIDSSSNTVAVYYVAANNVRACVLFTITASSSAFIAMHTLPDNEFYTSTTTKTMGLSAVLLGRGLILVETSKRTMALLSYAQPKAIAGNSAAAGDTVYGVYDGTVHDPGIAAGTDISTSGVKAHAYIDGCLSVTGWWR